MVRVALRCAILSDQLEGRAFPFDNCFAIEVKSTIEKNLKYPSIAAIEATIALDFKFDNIDVTKIDDGVLRVDAEDVAKWAKKNSLE
jgi:hypothetical protein